MAGRQEKPRKVQANWVAVLELENLPSIPVG